MPFLSKKGYLFAKSVPPGNSQALPVGLSRKMMNVFRTAYYNEDSELSNVTNDNALLAFPLHYLNGYCRSTKGIVQLGKSQQDGPLREDPHKRKKYSSYWICATTTKALIEEPLAKNKFFAAVQELLTVFEEKEVRTGTMDDNFLGHFYSQAFGLPPLDRKSDDWQDIYRACRTTQDQCCHLFVFHLQLCNPHQDKSQRFQMMNLVSSISFQLFPKDSVTTNDSKLIKAYIRLLGTTTRTTSGIKGMV